MGCGSGGGIELGRLVRGSDRERVGGKQAGLGCLGRGRGRPKTAAQVGPGWGRFRCWAGFKWVLDGFWPR